MIYLIFGVHNHQPIGNFEHIFQMASNKAYYPFLEQMYAHPKIKFSLHCTGILWDYFKNKCPEYIALTKKMLSRGQIELLTGGYYEPILPSIPDRDKIGQITKLSKFIKDEFSYYPRGLWLAERVWEEHLPKILNQAGVEYTIVDDFHFIAAGFNNPAGYYTTEEQGYILKIFPISQKLRYLIPFKPVESVIEYLLQVKDNTALTIIDDGEKFGLWPGTYKHVYLEGWIKKFLDALEQNSDRIVCLTFSEYIDLFPSTGLIYFPTASYFEMTEWSLPSDTQETFEEVIASLQNLPDGDKIQQFMRGGNWRNFFVKYSEANNIHKKMLYVSNKIQQYNELLHSKKIRPKVNSKKANFYNRLIAQSLDSLYAGQCNCAYWHGVFGGLYLPHLRTTIYKNLISAETLLNKISGYKKTIFNVIDFNMDGNKEIIVETPTQNLYFAPSYGGALIEWDLKPLNINLLNILTRRKEAYHHRLLKFLDNNDKFDKTGVKSIHELIQVKEENLDQYLYYDRYNRVSLLDHFLHPKTTKVDLIKCKYNEQGDFIPENYHWGHNSNTLTLQREGIVWSDEKQIKVSLVKKILILHNGIKISYMITNIAKIAFETIFAPEFSFFFCDRTSQDNMEIVTTQWTYIDKSQSLQLHVVFDQQTHIWTFPLETVSLSESGFERIFQGIVILPFWRIKLADTFNVDFKIYWQCKNKYSK